jgi:hypothetical protein
VSRHPELYRSAEDQEGRDIDREHFKRAHTARYSGDFNPGDESHSLT